MVDWAHERDTQIQSLSILSHAQPGALSLGNQWITADTLDRTASDWQLLGQVLAPDATINLFGCDLAGPGADHHLLLDGLATLSGADVFASDDVTGAGGDWQLEAASAHATAQWAAGQQVPLDLGLLQSSHITLAPVTFSGTVYTDEGTTNIGANKTVRIAINGADHPTTAETDVAGQYAVSDLILSSGDVVTVYLEDETEDAVAVTVSDGNALAGLDLYQDRLDRAARRGFQLDQCELDDGQGGV